MAKSESTSLPNALRAALPLLLLGAAGCVQILGLRERPEATDGGDADAHPATTGGLTDATTAEGGPAEAAAADGSLADAATAVAGQCGGLLHPSAPCAACMDQNCCVEDRSCAGDSACNEAADCLASCTDDACRARCGEFYALPAALTALRACRVSHCADACSSSCGEFVSPVSACQTCQQGSCCALGTACASNPDCAALNLCTANCFGTPSCPSDCQMQYPLGAADYQAWSTCTAQCATSCPSGQSWACLDSPIVWPKPPASGMVTFSVTFVDFSAEEPFVGALVKACDKLDYSCVAPRAQSMTDGSGLVSLTVPSGLNGFDGYLDITGGTVASTGAAAFPTIWYPLPFVIADGWRGRTQILNADEFSQTAMVTGGTIDPTRGHFAINAVDCDMSAAAKVSFTVDIADAQTVSYYLVMGVPETSQTATDASGVGAFLNLPTNGPARLAAVHAFSGLANGKSMGTLSFVIRPGTLTTGSSFPPIP
jgi:hypothetical protein